MRSDALEPKIVPTWSRNGPSDSILVALIFAQIFESISDQKVLAPLLVGGVESVESCYLFDTQAPLQAGGGGFTRFAHSAGPGFLSRFSPFLGVVLSVLGVSFLLCCEALGGPFCTSKAVLLDLLGRSGLSWAVPGPSWSARGGQKRNKN